MPDSWKLVELWVKEVASQNHYGYYLLLGSVGYVVVAEPNGISLTMQVEEVTSGHIRRRIILVALSLVLLLYQCLC